MLVDALSLLTLFPPPVLFLIVLALGLRFAGDAVPPILRPSWLTSVVFLGLWPLATVVHGESTVRDTARPVIVGIDIILNAPLRIAQWFQPARPSDVLTLADFLSGLGWLTALMLHLYLLAVLGSHGVWTAWDSIRSGETES